MVKNTPGVVRVDDLDEDHMTINTTTDVDTLLEYIRKQNALGDREIERLATQQLITFIYTCVRDGNTYLIDYMLSIWVPALYTSLNNVAIIRTSYLIRNNLTHWYSTLSKLRLHHIDRPSLFVGLPTEQEYCHEH